MRIQCLTPFKDGIDSFEKDDVRTVSDERGAYFVANGWALDLDGQLATGEKAAGAVDLNIQNGQIGVGDNHG